MGDDGGEDDFDGAFKELFKPAFGVAYRILGNVADAEDAAAEALARALVSWRKVGPLPYRDAWVMRVAANVAIDVVRKRRTVPIEDSIAEDQTENAQLRVALVAALAALSRRQREVVSLRYVAGLSDGEVASCLGISVNSVKKHMLRGTNNMRERLGREWQEVEPVAD
jgi:RNA polymerase sigma-70 factor (ECF subfamily)